MPLQSVTVSETLHFVCKAVKAKPMNLAPHSSLFFKVMMLFDALISDFTADENAMLFSH